MRTSGACKIDLHTYFLLINNHRMALAQMDESGCLSVYACVPKMKYKLITHWILPESNYILAQSLSVSLPSPCNRFPESRAGTGHNYATAMSRINAKTITESGVLGTTAKRFISSATFAGSSEHATRSAAVSILQAAIILARSGSQIDIGVSSIANCML